MYFVDGSVYEGEWYLGQARGQGSLKRATGEKYDGAFMNDKMHGFGKYVHTNQGIYEGNWAQDFHSGVGREIWPDGSQFQGYYLLGKKNGFGKYTWNDQSTY